MIFRQRHLTNSVIMVRPHDFGFNEQTGTDNEFQHRPKTAGEALLSSKNAMAEFEQMVNIMRNASVEVLLLDKAETSMILPDAIFPNNWFSTTSDGRLFLYPMKTKNRQAEVQEKELQALFDANNYMLNEVIDLRCITLADGQRMKALEGTGSLIFHHPTGTIFAAISERCNKTELDYFADTYDYVVFSFASESKVGLPIYHTNVLMSCGENFAVITEQILHKDSATKAALERLKDCVEDVISISEQQMAESFCGNILQLCDTNNQPVIVMSESAFKGFTPQQITKLEKHGNLIVCPIPTIEYIGGGSARCMIAENFLSK